MAELADAADLGSAGETRGGSSPSGRTTYFIPDISCFLLHGFADRPRGSTHKGSKPQF
jgi:hypothetical protein